VKYEILFFSVTLLIGLAYQDSYSVSEPDSFENCTNGEYREYFWYGGWWEVTSMDSKHGVCFFEVYTNHEMGYSVIKCGIPLEQMKASNWKVAWFPIDSELNEKFCSVTKSGNIYDYNWTDYFSIIGIFLFFLITVGLYFSTWAIVKKILHKKHSKLIGFLVAIAFIIISFISTYWSIVRRFVSDY